MDCYRCGQEGHARSECPQRWPAPAATRATPVAVISNNDRVPLRHEPDPPTPQYLETRDQAGMPSHAEHILIACPWCRAGAYQQCINVGTRRVTWPHQARLDAASITADTARRDLAQAQLAEARASHPDLDAWFARAQELPVPQDQDQRDNPHDEPGTDHHSQQD